MIAQCIKRDVGQGGGQHNHITIFGLRLRKALAPGTGATEAPSAHTWDEAQSLHLQESMVIDTVTNYMGCAHPPRPINLDLSHLAQHNQDNHPHIVAVHPYEGDAANIVISPPFSESNRMAEVKVATIMTATPPKGFSSLADVTSLNPTLAINNITMDDAALIDEDLPVYRKHKAVLPPCWTHKPPKNKINKCVAAPVAVPTAKAHLPIVFDWVCVDASAIAAGKARVTPLKKNMVHTNIQCPNVINPPSVSTSWLFTSPANTSSA
ncbi:hypothetical protein DACRYDRAFT_18865 [Dacryopinax primogenitus]|uniref:Uncharacterized protein n=1 Tax=Dacryopinax primogenitus (strain DJM 731) TaxID=1858805 RepID=M5FQS7_DACPD|nr:uncharacterized protein DACRYDRAFT_18865 [Dacryopinax primogenitus]EJT97129.1 hypothetical protein DACRYDRAFT_18865 [Dacryopinax primogenitus]